MGFRLEMIANDVRINRQDKPNNQLLTNASMELTAVRRTQQLSNFFLRFQFSCFLFRMKTEMKSAQTFERERERVNVSEDIVLLWPSDCVHGAHANRRSNDVRWHSCLSLKSKKVEKWPIECVCVHRPSVSRSTSHSIAVEINEKCVIIDIGSTSNCGTHSFTHRRIDENQNTERQTRHVIDLFSSPKCFSLPLALAPICHSSTFHFNSPVCDCIKTAAT